MVIDARGPSIGPSAAEILASHAGGTGSPTKTAVRVADAIAARGDDGTWLSTVPREQLLAAAEEIEKRSGARTLPLYGVPFGINDSIDVEGCRPHSPAPTTPTLRRRRPRWCGACSTRARCTSARRIWTSSPPDSTAPARPTPSRAVCAATRCVRITVPARGLHRSPRMEGRGRPRQLLADQRRDDRNPLFPWAFRGAGRAQWASGLIDNALNAAGTSAAKVGLETLNGAGVVYDGLQTLGEGAVLVGLILGTMVTFILEKKFLYAAIASFAGAVLSFIGLIHAPEVAWAANPQVALGYLFFGIICIAYLFLPGAKDPVEVDEADIVAGH